MPELILPTVRLHEAWLEAHREWGPGRHEDGFGLRAEDEVQSPDGFAAWVERLHRRADPRSVTEDGRGPVTFWWVVEDDRVCGGIALRHRLAESQLHLGHVGYGIRPSARRRGLAGWALGAVLAEARTLGLERVLVCCDAGNEASARTIQRNGGRLEDVRETSLGLTRRYWIEL